MATTPLLVPSTRYGELYRRRHPGEFLRNNFMEQEISVQSVEALLAVDDEEEQAPVVSPSEAYQEFETALDRGVVWLGPEIFVGFLGEPIGYSRQFGVSVDGGQPNYVCASPAAREEDVALGCSLLFRWLEASGVSRVSLSQTYGPLCVVPGPVLSRFLTKTASLEKFTAIMCRFCEPHIRALSDASARSELEVILDEPRLTSLGKLALVTSMKQNQGPAEFRGRLEDTRLLADAIPGNTRLKNLTLYGLSVENDHDEITTLMQSFSEDKGIQELKFHYLCLRDENWELLSGALAEHPHLHTLEFRHTGYTPLTGGTGVSEAELPEETKLFRAQQIAELLKTNTVLTNVFLHFDHALIATEIEPRLRINRFRLKVKAITKAPYAWRRQLLGRALDAVSHDAATLQFMLLVQNADVLVSNETPCASKRDRAHSTSSVSDSDNGKRACAR